MNTSARGRLSYAAVTPARDEEENLARLGAAMVAQTTKPTIWVIVENGSSDATPAVARGLAAAHPWIRVLQTSGSDGYDRTSPYMRAFHAGVESLSGRGDVVVKLDADVSIAPDFFELMLEAFESDAGLGITSGALYEEDSDGIWRERTVLGHHCWGPTRAYRRDCMNHVLPLDDGIGYAAIDLTKAHLAGFQTRTLNHLPFRHHRPEGGRQGAWKSWEQQGEAAHYVGYRLSYLLVRCAYRLREDPAAVALLTGYARAALGRRPRYVDKRVVLAMRDRQRAGYVLTNFRRRQRRALTS